MLFGPGVRVFAFRPNEGSIKKPGEAVSEEVATIYKIFDTRGTKYEAISYELVALRRRLIWKSDIAVLWETEIDNVQLRGKARLRIVGWDAKTVAYINRDIDRILTGHPVILDRRPVWHQFFDTDDGIAYLKGTGSYYNVHVHRSTSERKLYLFGSHAPRNMCAAAFINMVNLLTIIPPDPESEPKYKIEGDCMICLGEVVQPYQTWCGHVYCRDCFTHQCAHIEQKDLPVRCLTCEKVFSLAELQSALDYFTFEGLLARALGCFVNANYKTLHYCPKPDCPQVYDASGGILTCPTYFVDICLECHVLYHKGETCTAYQERTREGHEAFVQWKEEHNAKDCPKCGITIQKTAGCNHVKCERCKADFCWVCLAAFRIDNEVYEHMQRVHGGFVDHPNADPEEGIFEVVEEAWADIPHLQLEASEDDEDSESGDDLDVMQLNGVLEASEDDEDSESGDDPDVMQPHGVSLPAEDEV